LSNRQGNIRIFSKMDKVLASGEAILAFPAIMYEVLSQDISDNCHY